jgi:hypothetical protein
VNAVVAAIMHNLGSLLVVFNSARLVRHGEELEPFVREEEKPAAPSAPVKPSATLQPQVA